MGLDKMNGFKHYILTRFNVGLYGPDSQAAVGPDQWMEHRLRLFESFTVPCLAKQSCQDFTWLVLIDRRTPDRYMDILEGISRPATKVIYPVESGNAWIEHFEPGDYDLVTTRIDNDDAFHIDAVAAIQQMWRSSRPLNGKPWVIVFPYGLILELAGRRIIGMEYWYNNCPTLVEPRSGAQTVWRWDHSNIPQEIEHRYIKDKPYWLQVVHSQNLKNAMPEKGSVKILHEDVSVRLEALAHFGVDHANLPSA